MIVLNCYRIVKCKNIFNVIVDECLWALDIFILKLSRFIIKLENVKYFNGIESLCSSKVDTLNKYLLVERGILQTGFH